MSSVIYATTGSIKVEGTGESSPQPTSKTKTIHRYWNPQILKNPGTEIQIKFPHTLPLSHSFCKSQGDVLWIAILPETYVPSEKV